MSERNFSDEYRIKLNSRGCVRKTVETMHVTTQFILNFVVKFDGNLNSEIYWVIEI